MRYRRQVLNSILGFVTALTLVGASVGCGGKLLSSKWALDDPGYAAKYSEPYGTRKNERMLKQMVDARHVEGQSGWYLMGLGANDPGAAGAELGIFSYPTAIMESRVGVQGLVGTRESDWFVGLTPGVRLQPPSRLAPFVGVASFLGGNEKTSSADSDGRDNDDDGFIDELGEEKSDTFFRLGVGPEVGVHYWLNGSSRLTVSGQHLFSTEGRASDMWMFGLTFSVLTGPDRDDAETTHVAPAVE